MTSLRVRLLVILLPLLVIVSAVAAGGAYVFMSQHLTAAYDLDLGDIARALVPHLRMRNGSVALEFSELADTVLRNDSVDQIFYEVRDSQGRLVAGDAELPRAPEFPSGSPFYWNTARGGKAIRAVALKALVEGSPVTIVAAETTNKRRRAERDALVSALGPVSLLSIASVFAVLLAVRRGLRPLDRVRDEMQERSHVDLRPFDDQHVVEELRPLVRELNRMFGRLQEAQATQARFIANAAHQLRTPIAGLVTQLNLARSDDPGSRAHVASAFEAASRLARLAQQILSLAAADPISNPTGRDEPCDLAEIARGRADQWLRATSDRGVEIEFDLQPAALRGNPVLLGELASNLIDNAARYGARNVRVATRTEGGAAIFEVCDDGPGIAPDQRTRIFERFHRLDNESTEGSGLGLAIVSEIAQRHNGAIEVREGMGNAGTCVHVAFRSQSPP
jgi:two-component system, OmpR family, sensor histidine kinase TctE